MLMRSILRRCTPTLHHSMAVYSRCTLPMATMGLRQARMFSLPRYHFDDQDYEPTVTQVSITGAGLSGVTEEKLVILLLSRMVIVDEKRG